MRRAEAARSGDSSQAALCSAQEYGAQCSTEGLAQEPNCHLLPASGVRPVASRLRCAWDRRG